MFRRLAAIFLFGVVLSGGALAAESCVIENNSTGSFVGFPGDNAVSVNPGSSGLLRANCTAGINSYSWFPGNSTSVQIPYTAPQTPGASVTYTLNGFGSAANAPAVSLTLTVLPAAAPDCTLTAAPNPVLSGQTVTFTRSCSATRPAPDGIEFTDLRGVQQSTSFATFTDTAPTVTVQTVREMFYHPYASGGNGIDRVLAVTILPPVAAPSNCTLAAAPAQIVLGASTTLTATCTGGSAPDTYQFLDGNQNVIRTAASNQLVVTPATLGTNIYIVRASNAGGQAPSASAQVNVVPPVPSGCSVTATPNPVVLGGTTTLTGQCTGGGAASGYRFTLPDGSVVVSSTPTLVATPAAVGTLVYGFVATNAGGNSAASTVSVVVQPAACTINASVPNPVARNTSVTLTASCNNQPSIYAWSTAAGAITSTSGPTLTVTPAATTTYTVTTVGAGQSLVTASYTVTVFSASAIAAVAGSPITGTPGRALSRAMQVRVTDATGAPVAGELVNWSVVNPGSSPGAFAASPSAASDAQGLTSNTFTMGNDGGGRTLRACLAALPAVCADFTVLPGASAIAAIVGTTITGSPGRPLSRELQVRVADQAGAPVAGELVNWSVVNPGTSPGTFGSNPSPATDAQGVTRNTFTMGTNAGGRTLRACLASVPTVCTDFQVVAGAAGLVAIAGTPLVGAPGRPLSRALQVRATDAQGNPVPQETVNWTVVNQGDSAGTFGSNPSPVTDAQGLTANTFTMGNDAGGRTLRACLASQPAVCADFSVLSLNAALERPTAKIMSPMAELAIATPLAQLSNIRYRLDQLRLRRNPAVLDALRVRVAGQSLPAFSAFALAPLDKNGKPVPQKGGGAAADDPFERLGFFVNGDVELGKQSATGIQSGYDLRTKGVTLGADYRLSSDSVVGVTAGFMNASTDLADEGGSQGARGYSFSAYGSFTPVAGAYLDVIAHAGSNKYDTRRRDLSVTGTPVDYDSNTRGSQVAFAITAGADVSRGPLTMNPYVRLDYVNAKIDSFSESGGSGAIQVGDLDLKNTVVTLGGQLSYAISTSWGVLMPNTRLELQRRIQGDGRIVSAQLVADSTINAQVPLELADKNYGNFSVGVSAVLPRGVSGFASYERLFGREGYGNSKYTVGVRFEF